MRLIAFITEGAQIRKILEDNAVQIEPDWGTDWDLAAQATPDFDVDQRVNW
jgi:hypothetical protein